MVKVDKIIEVAETKAEPSNKSYLDIKPNEPISDAEMSDFIANELKKAREEAELDTYDKLLSEVFNRDENEIDIDFNFGEKLSSLLDKFKEENWSDFDIKDKISMIKELIDSIGKELNIDSIPELIITDDDDAYGYYDAQDNAITLNSQFFSNASELVNTVAHEVRHAFQHIRAELMETWQDALYKVNFENYISPMPLPGGGWLFFTDYMDQYVEVDARAFANLFTEAMKL